MLIVFIFRKILKAGHKIIHAIWLKPCKKKVEKILEGIYQNVNSDYLGWQSYE